VVGRLLLLGWKGIRSIISSLDLISGPDFYFRSEFRQVPGNDAPAGIFQSFYLGYGYSGIPVLPPKYSG
jgi:hypothetical protein